MRDNNRSMDQFRALGELRRALYSYSMNAGKTRVTQRAKDQMGEKIRLACLALLAAEGRAEAQAEGQAEAGREGS